MTTPQWSLPAVLARTADVTQTLGIDTVAGVAAIRAFLEGPFVVAVAGLPKTGRSRIGAALQPASSDIDILELDVRTVPTFALWDVLVIVTPADRALSRAEEELVRTTRQQRRPVAVAVTRSDLLGDAQSRVAAQEEIEKFRLNPILGALGVRWFFCGANDSVDGLSSFVAQALGRDPAIAHEGPVLEALSRVLELATGQLGERLAAREREFSVLREVEAQLPLALAHAEGEVKLARLSVRDTLRDAEEKIFEAGLTLGSSAVAWISCDGVGAWSDVEQPLRDAWAALLEIAEQTLEVSRRRFQDEAMRIAEKVDRASATVGLSPGKSDRLRASWSTSDLDEALESTAKVDLEPLFKAVLKECQDALKRNEDEAKNRKNVAHRIASNLQYIAAGSIDDRLRTQVHADLEALVRTKLGALTDAASRAAEDGARQDATSAAVFLKERVTALRTALEERHSWGGAYGELLELRAWTGGRTRSHGI